MTKQINFCIPLKNLHLLVAKNEMSALLNFPFSVEKKIFNSKFICSPEDLALSAGGGTNFQIQMTLYWINF